MFCVYILLSQNIVTRAAAKRKLTQNALENALLSPVVEVL